MGLISILTGVLIGLAIVSILMAAISGIRLYQYFDNTSFLHSRCDQLKMLYFMCGEPGSGGEGLRMIAQYNAYAAAERFIDKAIKIRKGKVKGREGGLWLAGEMADPAPNTPFPLTKAPALMLKSKEKKRRSKCFGELFSKTAFPNTNRKGNDLAYHFIWAVHGASIVDYMYGWDLASISAAGLANMTQELLGDSDDDDIKATSAGILLYFTKYRGME